MGRVLLLDADQDHATAIAWALRNISCQTTTSSNLRSVLSFLQTQKFEVVVVVTTPGPNWNVAVETILYATTHMTELPQVVCMLRGPYRGPNERVYAARKGFRVIYEK
jgi:DNA-binding NtrC family response regulator